MMATKIVVLTAHELVQCFTFEADCTVNQIESNAPKHLTDNVRPGDRVLTINGNGVFDRSELNSFVMGVQPEFQNEVEFLSMVNEGLNSNIRSNTIEDFAASVQVDGGASTVSKVPPPPEEEDDYDPAAEFEEFAQGAPVTVTPPHNDPSDRDNPINPKGEPSLLGFDQIDTHTTTPGEKSLNNNSQSFFRTSLEKALAKIPFCRCVILLVDSDVNPLAEIEGLAQTQNLPPPTVIDFGVKMRNRITDAQLGEMFRSTVKAGNWFVVVRANKCLSLLSLLATLLQEAHAHGLKDIHPGTKIIIETEPHPHFPKFLAKESRTLQVKNTMTQSAILFESIAGSIRKLQFIQDQPSASMSNQALAAAKLPNTAAAAASSPERKKKKVRISCELDVVDIESRQVFQVESLHVPTGTKTQKTVGAVTLRHTSSALPNDKFFALARAGDQRRYAVASSLGNLYVIDHRGAALLSAHLHDASIWDTDFYGKDLFVTGAEDSSAVCWRSLPDGNVQRVASMRCPNDIYSVRFTGNGQAFAAGGLMSAMMLRSLSTSSMATVELSTSIQSMAAYGATDIIAGGGDGSAFVIDAVTQKITNTLRTIHSKKIPAMCVNGETLITGSFDSSVKLWDLRSGSTAPQHTMKFKQYITGLDANGYFLSGCVGDSLYLWDVRKLECILGGCSKAWSGLSRAVRVDAVDQFMITASPDGVIRFWEFQ